MANFLVLSHKIDGFPNPVLKIDGFPNPVLKIDGFLGTHADEAPVRGGNALPRHRAAVWLILDPWS